MIISLEMPSGVSPTDLAQGVAAIAGLVVALGLGITQFVLAAREKRERIAAYLIGAVAAIEYAEAAMDEADRAFGKLQMVPRAQIQLAPALHYLRAAEAALMSFPLATAPSSLTARSLLSVLRQIRNMEGSVQSFLSTDSTHLKASFAEETLETGKAAIALRAEAKRILKRRDIG